MFMSELNSTLFPVKEVPAIGSPIGIDDKEIDDTGYKFIVREDTGQVLSCVTDEYKLVTNTEVIDATNKALKSTKAKFKEAVVFGEGARTKWTWTFPNVKVKVRKDHYVNPEIHIKNSYDGSSTVDIMAGAFRLVCSNGMVIGTILGHSRAVHSVYNVNLDKIEELVDNVINKSKQVFNKDFPNLVETPIKRKHITELIKMIPTQAMEPLTQYLLGHKPKTYWDLLNAATWITSHHLNRNNESTHKMESTVYPTISRWANA